MIAKKNGSGGTGAGIARRILSLALSAAMLFGLLPSLNRTAEAAEWMTAYLEKMAEWGIMEGGTPSEMDPDRQLTRAEFVSLVNRAFGYTETGRVSFSDVPENAWYAEDINIAYTAGYFGGTSANTASPLDLVTREQAAVMLARNLRLQGLPGGGTPFADDHELGNWSRRLVQECAQLGIIGGYADGTFRPKNYITRGQMACFLVRALGTLINQTGEQSAGGVYGNLTINSPGVKLRDSVVTGNLYLTGGVGLGSVELENVTVMGKIIVCGTGEAEKGENSLLLRNVTAEAMEIDSLVGQFMSLQTDGLTNIGSTIVRTSAYLEDLTDNNLGLRTITLDGSDGVQLQLAGNIKEVINLTPNSTLQVVQGVSDKVTVDEHAVGSTLHVANNTSVRELNLDVGTPVTGNGDVGRLNIGAAGSSVTMLPDNVTIRPGINGTVHGEVMDNVTAAESSEDPRILAGYPRARNVASTTAEGVFRTNKRGTLYWAVTSLMDGSADEDMLLTPALYPGRVVRSGTANVTASSTDVIARITGLTRDGSYYLSAMLKDDRGRYSPIKTVAFTTTDDSVPNFAAGYPTASVVLDDEDEQVVQASVMATKSCQLYYALLPRNAMAPTAATLRAAAVNGNLGYGVMDVEKNVPYLIPQVNTGYLMEETGYDLYLWLNDADNGKSSAVRRLQVTTLDRTAPTIQRIEMNDHDSTWIEVKYVLSEPGTMYWVLVRRGVEFYSPGTTYQDLVAKIQVEAGIGIENRYKGRSTNGTIRITGLQPQTAYDLYYVAKDAAGNYNVYTSSYIPPLPVNTLDTQPPEVKEQVFTHPGTSATSLDPYPDTGVQLVFSESVQGQAPAVGGVTPPPSVFLDLYTDVLSATAAEKPAREEALADALREHIELYYMEEGSNMGTLVTEERTRENEGTIGNDWVIDYRKAQVYLDTSGSGEMMITFPSYNTEENKRALNLSSGTTYYFELKNIQDTSTNHNDMEANVRGGITRLDAFTTIDAQLVFSTGVNNGTLADGTRIMFDTYFKLTPVTAASVSEDTMYDLLFWSTTSMKFALYYRDKGDTYWTRMERGESTEAGFRVTELTPEVGVSIGRELRSDGDEKRDPNFEQLKYAKEREYGIVVTELEGDTDRDSWSGKGYRIRVTPVSGPQGSLAVLSRPTLTPEGYEDHQKSNLKVKEIGVPETYRLPPIDFIPLAPPTFKDGYPTFEAEADSVKVGMSLDPSGNYYYVVAPVGYLTTSVIDEDGNSVRLTEDNWEDLLPEDGYLFNGTNSPNVTLPLSDQISDPRALEDQDGYIIGSGRNSGSFRSITIPEPSKNESLEPDTKYVAYFVLESEGNYSDVYAFRFQTKDVVQPVLQVSINNPNADVRSDRKANVRWFILVDGTEGGTVLAETIDWDSANEGVYGDGDDYAEWKKLTVLEAMSTYVRRNGRVVVGSVFDLFASERQRNNAAGYIETVTPRNGSIQTVQDEEHPGSNQAVTKRCQQYMDPNNTNMTYWFVAMGRTGPVDDPEKQSTPAFAAAPDLYYPVANPRPQVQSITTTPAPGFSAPSDLETAVDTTYRGTVSIVFSTALHFSSGGTKPVVDKALNDPTFDRFGNYVSSGSLFSVSSGSAVSQYKAKGSTDNPPCYELSIDFVMGGFRTTTGPTINFYPELSNERGFTGLEPLTLSSALIQESGQWIPVFYINNPTSNRNSWGNPVVRPSLPANFFR